MDRSLIIDLYDLYKGLLTEKQQKYFEEYYFYDLSYAEIAANFSVSRNAVFDQIKKTKELLMNYENHLDLHLIYTKLSDTLDIDDLDEIKIKIKEIIKE